MKIEIISGLLRKAPAAVLLSLDQQRILLDAGSGLENDEAPWPIPDRLDAILLSHDHVDHIAGIDRLAPEIPIYCTATTARALPPGRNIVIIQPGAHFQLGNIMVTTGSAGHAFGGIWFHFACHGGIFYSGDISLESALFRFTPPPAARIALVDASYGLYDTPQEQQLTKIRQHLQHPTLCPVPPSGRAVELALLAFRTQQKSLALDPQVSAMLQLMAQQDDGTLQEGIALELQTLANSLAPFSLDAQLILAGDPDGVGGVAGELHRRKTIPHRTLFTGHLHRDAHRQWQAGEVDFCRWNVHPTRACLQKLVTLLSCQALVPLFTEIADPDLWQTALDCQIVTTPIIEIAPCN